MYNGVMVNFHIVALLFSSCSKAQEPNAQRTAFMAEAASLV